MSCRQVLSRYIFGRIQNCRIAKAGVAGAVHSGCRCGIESGTDSFRKRLSCSLGCNRVIEKELFNDLLHGAWKSFSKLSELLTIEKLNIDLIQWRR